MFTKKIILISVVSVFSPFLVYAQSLNLSSPKVSYNVGDNFFASLNINTAGNSINTVSGKIIVPTDKFAISEVRFGNSIISLWVEKPTINHTTGEIAFSGGLPGGYNGSSGPILSIGLKAKKTGSASVKPSDFIVLLNDGLGTQLQNLTLGSLNLSISSAPPPKPVSKPEEKKEETKQIYELPADSVPPEEFTPLISRHHTIANNKYFVSFNAIDKDSGIAKYEVREELWILSKISKLFISDWRQGITPFVLKFQLWKSKIIVRAYDSAGNYTEGFAIKPFSSWLLWIFAIAGIALTAVLSRQK